jgi:hypothetical protein
VTTDAAGSFHADLPEADVDSGTPPDLSISYDGRELLTVARTPAGSGTADSADGRREHIAASEEGYEIVIERTYQDLTAAIEGMGQAMAEAQSEYRPSYFGIPASQLPAECIPGKTYFYTADGIVGCNKCDDTFLTSSGLGLATGSDCADSILLGIAYSLDPFGPSSAYYRSGYCVAEAMGDDTHTQNVYCNGSYKSDGHYNRSWFPGINHTERFHLHDGSGTVYS